MSIQQTIYNLSNKNLNEALLLLINSFKKINVSHFFKYLNDYKLIAEHDNFINDWVNLKDIKLNNNLRGFQKTEKEKRDKILYILGEMKYKKTVIAKIKKLGASQKINIKSKKQKKNLFPHLTNKVEIKEFTNLFTINTKKLIDKIL